jgi:peptidoglycan/LPS O-acetylase OafA/YrhL
VLAAEATPAPAGPDPRSGRPHLAALDVVRLVTVATVIAVHLLSQLIPADGAAGAVLSLLHSSREVFLLLSALVLTYSGAGRPVSPSSFWRRRAPLVLAPYALWTVIYFVADGPSRSPAAAAGRLAVDLLSGGARYHLYFVLLTLQLYLVFPWVRPWVARRAARPARLVAASAALQLAFTSVAHYRLAVPPPLSWLTTHPGTWLPSYQLYVVLGVVVGLRSADAARWCADHLRLLSVAAAAAATVTLLSFALSVTVARTGTLRASEVFQPAVVLESVAFAAVELGVGVRLCRRSSRRVLAGLARGSDLSFAVYLAHPLLIQALLAWTPVRAWLAALPAGVAVAAVVLVVTPAVLVITGAMAAALRATPLSLALTGRRTRRPVRAAQPAEEPGDMRPVPVGAP